jgi:hypothetical protein
MLPHATNTRFHSPWSRSSIRPLIYFLNNFPKPLLFFSASLVSFSCASSNALSSLVGMRGCSANRIPGVRVAAGAVVVSPCVCRPVSIGSPVSSPSESDSGESSSPPTPSAPRRRLRSAAVSPSKPPSSARDFELGIVAPRDWLAGGDVEPGKAARRRRRSAGVSSSESFSSAGGGGGCESWTARRRRRCAPVSLCWPVD